MDEYREWNIITRLKSGDISALTPLVKAYQHRALRASYLITQDRALAQDVTQSAFLRAFEHIDQFDSSRRFLPWFLRIVVNMSVQTAKRQSQMLSLDTSAQGDADEMLTHLLSDAVPNPETQVEMRDLEDSIQAMLEQLSPDQRAVIVLRYYVDLTEKQMSHMLNVPPGTVKSRLHAAREQLRRMLRLNVLEGR